MSFKDLKLNSTYNSSKNDLVIEFYGPVLSEAVSYDRVTGFFNSKSLALVASGLKGFISNNGKMRLLCGSELQKDDIDAILNSSEIAEKLSDSFLNDLNNISDEIELNHIKLLAWMVDNDFLDIKIGIVKNNKGYIGGILHEKTGILSDKFGNTIVFSGSNNETNFGWVSGGFGNIEKFKVFLSWEDSKFIVDDLNSFEEYWNNENKFLEVLSIPNAAKEGLIKLAPKNIDEVMKLPLEFNICSNSKDKRKLRDYQEEAISKWCENNKKGIFKMATGTGKTFTALNCISSALNDDLNLITVIACPYAHLTEQWLNDVENNLGIKCYSIYASANTNWKKDFADLVFKLRLGIIKKAIILTTHNTFSMDFFKDKISEINNPLLLVVDEMHKVVSDKFSRGLLECYEYRLGLSATPEVYNNEVGTNFVLSYFGGIIYSFDLDDALNNCDEEGKTYLAPYEYLPQRVGLNESELSQYIDLSRQISRFSHMNKEHMSDYYKLLLQKRKDIVNNANEKYDCLSKILDDLEDVSHLIIFCSHQQMDNVLKILKDKEILGHKFTYSEGTKKSNQYGGLSEREYLIKQFDEGVYKALVAIKCLDEGVDIPSADKVIIMSSSRNPREYVQRRGRVLRRSDGKEKADIYDMAVIEYDYSGEIINSIVEPEMERMIDFINSSDNSGYCMKLLEKWSVIL